MPKHHRISVLARRVAAISAVAALAVSGLPRPASAVPGVNDLAVGDVTVTETDAGTTNATFTVTRSGSLVLATSVDYQTTPGTATDPADYTGATGTITFNAGETEKTVVVAVKGDVLDEDNETFTLDLQAGSVVNGNIVDGQGLGTINDNDTPPLLAINDQTVVEGTSGTGVRTPATFTVQLTAASGRTVTVDYAATPATASSADFDPTTGTLTFPAGVTSRTITVPLVADALNELSEAFTVDLTNNASAGMGDAQGQGTITDDDAAPSIAIGDLTVSEGDSGTSVANVPVTLSAASGRTITVQYSTSNGSATAGSDYDAVSGGVVTFNPGEVTKAAPVTVKGDALDDAATETVNLTISNPTGGTTITDANGVLTITDDDGTPVISVADIEVEK